MAEYFDIVDENDNVIGKATREECHKNKLIHRGVHIFILNSKGMLLLQKRSMKKDLYKGYWCSSAAGHVKSGETYEQAAKTELKEELGINTKLKVICDYKERAELESHNIRLFLGFYDGPFKINKDEVEYVNFFELNDIEKMLKIEKFTPGTVLAFENYIKLK